MHNNAMAVLHQYLKKHNKVSYNQVEQDMASEIATARDLMDQITRCSDIELAKQLADAHLEIHNKGLPNPNGNEG